MMESYVLLIRWHIIKLCYCSVEFLFFPFVHSILSVFDHVLLWCYIFQCISWIMYTSIYFILFHANFKWQNTFCFLPLFPYAHTKKSTRKDVKEWFRLFNLECMFFFCFLQASWFDLSFNLFFICHSFHPFILFGQQFGNFFFFS